MRTKSRNRGRGLVLAVLTLIVNMPELARAQQSGLFPLAPIKRQRVPCDQEDPVYKIYKEKYFGYHPSCWRPFPTGWGCPSPAKQDVEKSFKERKLGMPEDAQPGGAIGEMPDAEQPSQRPAPPALPSRTRSPFDPPVTNGNAPANPAAPRQDPPARSPFETPDKPADQPGATPAAPREGRARPASAPIGDDGGPLLSAPDQPAQLPGARTSRSTRDDVTRSRDDDGPLLALPEVTLPPVAGSDAPFGTQPAQPGTASADSAPDQTIPANSAPRRGFLSGLFSNLGLNWTRR
jgi:hypothetical protein